MEVTFRRVSDDDLSMLHRWLNEPGVVRLLAADEPEEAPQWWRSVWTATRRASTTSWADRANGAEGWARELDNDEKTGCCGSFAAARDRW